MHLAERATSYEEKLSVVQGFFPMLDVACDGVVKVLKSLSLPPEDSKTEMQRRVAVRYMLSKLWEQADRFAPQVYAVTRTCISVFPNRYLEGYTFEREDFVHTGHNLEKRYNGVLQLGFRLSDGGQRVVVKKIERALIDKLRWEDALNRRLELLLKVDHPSIAKLYHVERLPTCWYVYIEHVDGANLRSFLSQEDSLREEPFVDVVLSEAAAREVFRKLVDPVDYLFRFRGVILGDLK
jgi:hypothetical protein